MSGIEASALTTTRLVLTPLQPSDAAEMVRVLADEALYAFTGGEPPSLGQLRVRYEAQVAGPVEADQVWHNWIIRLRHNRQAVGFVQATQVGDTADVAWLVGVEWQRQGLATEGVAAMCAWLGKCGIGKITAHIHPEHAASQRVAAAVGLAPTAEVDSDGEVVWVMVDDSHKGASKETDQRL